MPDKTEEQIAKEREAVASMKGAKQNMALVLDRVDTLEMALRNTISALRRMKGYTPADALALPYGGGTPEKLHAIIDKDIAAAEAKLR